MHIVKNKKKGLSASSGIKASRIRIDTNCLENSKSTINLWPFRNIYIYNYTY